MRGLGHSVRLDHRHAEGGLELTDHRDGKRRRRRSNEAKPVSPDCLDTTAGRLSRSLFAKQDIGLQEVERNIDKGVELERFKMMKPLVEAD